MTPRSPSSCLYAVSSISITQRYALRNSAATHGQATLIFRSYRTQQQQPTKAIVPRNKPIAVARQPPTPPTTAVQTTDHEEYSPKAALLAVESGHMQDNLNPPVSTLPPPLDVPKRSSDQNVLRYLLRLGSAYGTFYKNGIKAVWFNRKAARMLREQVEARLQKFSDDAARRGGGAVFVNLAKEPVESLVNSAGSLSLVTRAEHEIIARHRRDIGKLPLFATLALVFGEWLPLLVPFMPSVVPGTCLIPSQTEGMRKAVEERRRESFRKGVVLSTNTIEQLRAVIAQQPRQGPKSMLEVLQQDHLLHLSTTFGLHKRLWDRLNIIPPRYLLIRSLVQRATYIGLDDLLLCSQGGIHRLSSQELAIACELRGIDVLHRDDATLREILTWWLSRQQTDDRSGLAFLDMLFKRPNAWGEKSNLNR